MAFKDEWKDLQDKIPGMEDSGSDITVAPINQIAGEVIKLEEDVDDLKNTIPDLKDDADDLKSTTQNLQQDVDSLELSTQALQNGVNVLDTTAKTAYRESQTAIQASNNANTRAENAYNTAADARAGASAAYQKAESAESIANGKQDKIAEILFADGSTLSLADNTNYTASEDIATLNVEYPETNFICSITFTTAETGDITISLPNSKYIGGVPEFANGETWELNIKNGVVVGGKIE